MTVDEKLTSSNWIVFSGDQNRYKFIFHELVTMIQQSNVNFAPSVAKLGITIVAFGVREHNNGIPLVDEVKAFFETKYSGAANTFFVSLGHSVLSRNISALVDFPKKYLGHFGSHEGGFSFWFPWTNTRISDAMAGTLELSNDVLNHIQRHYP